MAKVTRLDPRKPRQLGRTVYTDRGLRLPPARPIASGKWFWPAMAVLPLGAFAAVLFAPPPPASLTPTSSARLPSAPAAAR